MEDEKMTININKMHVGIGLIMLGIISIISAELIFFGEFGVKLFGYVLFPIGWGLITKHILPNQKGSFAIGLAFGIIGVIAAICLKSKSNKSEARSNNSKYEELKKLAELKQNGILTELEFEKEKEKLLK